MVLFDYSNLCILQFYHKTILVIRPLTCNLASNYANCILFNLYFKATWNKRLHFAGTKGDLKTEKILH